MGISRGVWKLAEENLSGAESVRETRASGIFVTATSTEVGKTVVAAVLARTLTGEARRVAVFKPALTGMDEYPGYDEAEALAAVADTVIATGSGLWPSAADLPDHATLRAAARCSSSGSSQPSANTPIGVSAIEMITVAVSTALVVASKMPTPAAAA